jgi:hypothetical protein
MGPAEERGSVTCTKLLPAQDHTTNEEQDCGKQAIGSVQTEDGSSVQQFLQRTW